MVYTLLISSFSCWGWTWIFILHGRILYCGTSWSIFIPFPRL